MTTPDEPRRDPAIAVHRLTDRLAGRPPDDELRRDISEQLSLRLQQWIVRIIAGSQYTSHLYTRAKSRLGITHDHVPGDMLAFELIDQILVLLHGHVKEFRNTRNFSGLEDHAMAALRDLDEILRDHLSLYKVGLHPDGETFGIFERVPAAVLDVVNAELQVGDAAASDLRQAWSSLHALTPNYDESYRKAIKAIELALKPLVAPNDSAASLGKMKATIRDGRWSTVLFATGPVGKSPSIAESETSSTVFLVDLLERLYGSERRHDGSASESQTSEEASAAVYAAVAILGWVRNGFLFNAKADYSSRTALAGGSLSRVAGSKVNR